MGRNQARVEKLIALLAEVRRAYAKKREKYSRELIRWEARAQRLEAEIEDLTDGGDPAERAIRAGAPIPRPNGAGRPVRSQHPFPHRVGNVTAWAEANGYTRRQVKSWYARRHGHPIPESAALLLKRQYGIALSSWPNGVKRG